MLTALLGKLSRLKNNKNTILKRKISVKSNLIAPLEINYNFDRSNPKNYQVDFIKDFALTLLPVSVEALGGECALGKRLPKILDIGCGFAPMALALDIYSAAVKPLMEKESEKKIVYVGIDIRKDSIDWLSTAYKNNPNYYFHHHETQESVDYVGDFSSFEAKEKNKTLAISAGDECNYHLPFPFMADIQWSCSVFTHLTPSAVHSALRYIAQNLAHDGVAINTWLVIDPQSCVALSLDQADRSLNYDMGDYLTYSRENPLNCTAYKIDFIYAAYENAGLEITSIERGSWRGAGVSNKFNHYQDVIISRRKV
jgi:SAM-dependent methyltransferase